MYPFKDGLTYPRNQWYIAAWSHEVTRELFERTLLGEPVVFYRTEGGIPVAVAGRCPHRRFPLVRASLIGDSLQCAYHGWTFDCTGKCVRIPSQEEVPAAFRVHAYPLVEKWQWLWIWMGDPAKAGPSLIPDHRELHLEDPNWLASIGGVEPLKARYQLMNENVLDLTHISYVHMRTIGTEAIAQTPVRFEDRGRYLHAIRDILDDRVTPFHAKALGIEGRVDRVLATDFYPPTLLSSGSSFFKAGEAHLEGGHHYGEFRVFHVATPETPTSSHYFWAFTRTFARDDDAVTEFVREGWRAGVLEDIDAIEANERMIDFGPPMSDLSAKADAGGIRSRRIVEAMMEAERRAAAPAPRQRAEAVSDVRGDLHPV